jgi:uncharacterized protein YegP (UPF0339 family)
MPASFELKSNNDGYYFFHFLDDTGAMLLMSGEYEDKSDAEQAIKDVKVGSLMSEQIAAGKVPAGDSFFVIKDKTGDILVKSILFDNQMVFDNALHTVKDNACVAAISDLT